MASAILRKARTSKIIPIIKLPTRKLLNSWDKSRTP